jgi:hypothetical protein
MDGYWYTVGERTGDRHYDKPLYEIVFDSGYRTTMTSQDIWRNKIKDWGSPSIYGVGIVGWRVPKPAKHPLYGIWHGMLERCLGKGKSHKWYKDVTIHPRWLRFDNFAADAVKLPGYDLTRIASRQLQLDKDKFGSSKGRREYGPETCCWLTSAEQAAYRRAWEHSNAPQCQFRGVHWTDGFWLARPQVKGWRPLLGCYRNPLHAAIAIHYRFPDYYFPHEKEQIRQAVKEAGMKMKDTMPLVA